MRVFSKQTGEIIDHAEVVPDQRPTAAETSRATEDKDFVKLYRRYVQQIADLGMANGTALKVLLFLIRNMDGTNAIGVTQSLIAEMTGLARQTVSKSLKYLETGGWIQTFKLGRANIYIVNPSVVWTSYADQKQYCKFQATLMLSSVDNWEISRRQQSKVRQLSPLTISKIAQALEEDPAAHE